MDEQVECVIALNAVPAIRKAVQEHPLRLVVTEIDEANLGAPYNTSGKAGIGLNRSHARLLKPRGIRINCVLPGIVSTPRSARAPTRDALARFRGGQSRGGQSCGE